MGKFKKACIKMLKKSWLLPIAYMGLDLAAVIATVGSPKIDSQEQLEQLVEEEKKELNCDKNIVPREVTCHINAMCWKTPKKDEYIIEIGIGKMNIASMKHEVYHICDGHVDAGYSFLGYWFLYEPQANFYAGFGWKL